jgi:hypothetical protein
MNNANDKVRTMEYIMMDDWNHPVYKCIETETLYKDIAQGKSDDPVLYSCGNEIDGDPAFPISDKFEIVFKTKYKESPYRFNYMMLSRLQMDCDAHLGISNRKFDTGRRKEMIEEMKSLYNSFPDGEKPEWLTWDDILNYEKLMTEQE